MSFNLRTKLLLSFALVLVLTGAVNAYGISQMNVLADLTTKIYNHPLQVTRAVLTAHVGIIKVHRSIKDIALARNDTELEVAKTAIDQQEKEVYEQFDIVQEWILGDEGQNLATEARQFFGEWKTIRSEVIALKEQGKADEATTITKTKGADHVAQLEERMIELRDYADGKATGMYESAEETRDNIVNISTMSLVVVMFVSAMIALYIANSITKPVQEVADAATRLASGDLEQSVTIRSQDEIGAMGIAFNQMAVNLRKSIETERQAKKYLEDTVSDYLVFVNQISQGNLTARLSINEIDDPLTRLGRNLNQMVERLREMTVQIREATNNISSATAEILAATTQQASGANEQSAAISETTATISQVRTIAEQAFQKAEAVAQKSKQTGEISQSGRQVVVDTIDGMSQIKEKVAGIAENILALSEQTQQIGEITATVNEIASQSNLLALNASVEAARAGEHGKGFAVVAVEVRNLAEQSKQATAQVKAILNEIQQATNSAVMATEQGTKGVDSGVLLTQQAGETIRQLADSIGESAQMAEQIVASVQQQTAGMEQITLAMQNINQATIQGLTSTQQTEKSARDLSTVSQQLKSLVAQYKLN